MSFRNLLFILCLFFLVSCEKEKTEFQSTGIITGPDYVLCMCCGGYFIEIEDSTYHFEHLPAATKIDLEKTTFPVSVNLDWQHSRRCGTIFYIEITRIEIKY